MERDPVTLSKRKIRVLLLEDRIIDAELIVQELERGGFAPVWDRVETEEEFAAAIINPLDIILADYALPQFDGLAALRLLQRQGLDIPFIVVSGALDDELVARCIRQGVTDYLLKDRLDRLGLAVSNALEERKLRVDTQVIEEQLRQAQKIESIGQLAGGIAHDFNNILTVINGRASLLLENEGLSSEVRDGLKEIYIAGERAAHLTRQLMLSSHSRSFRRQSLQLNDIIELLGQMLSRLIGEYINLGLDLARDLPPVEADAGMIEQVLINLAVNARDAMPRGGELTISTDAVELTAADVSERANARPGRFICMMVEDSGSGIPPEVLPRIFEPFYTTKGIGKGTGLGLATVFGIVNQHQGWIEVQTRQNNGVGTTFSIFLPSTKPVKPAGVQSWNAEPPPLHGHETILVVEDETSVREYAVAILQACGYRVLQARCGREALEVWQRHSSRIELLLTDIVLSGDVTGQELAKKLREEKPALAVICTSGYADYIEDGNSRAGEADCFIQKPYHPRALANRVRETLEGRSAAVCSS